MPVVFAAITPHPPVLIPEIGKDNLKKLAKTQSAIKKVVSADPDIKILVLAAGTVVLIVYPAEAATPPGTITAVEPPGSDVCSNAIGNG